MKQLKLYQVDAFTNTIFKGNPAAIIPLKEWLSDELMQAIATENNLSETAFFAKKEGIFQLRWFTPVCEVQLCGHATLASAHIIYTELGETAEELRFSTLSGILTVKQAGAKYIMDFPTDQLTHIETPIWLTEGLGTQVLATYKGREDFLAVLDSQDTLEGLKPNFERLKNTESRGVLATTTGTDVDFVSRCFFPQFGINEDPVTGSAHTTLAPYWAEQLGKTSLTARQISARTGEVHCELKGERVVLSGAAVTYLIGEMNLPI